VESVRRSGVWSDVGLPIVLLCELYKNHRLLLGTVLLCELYNYKGNGREMETSN
jgi:hypothetical protein